MLEAIIHEAGYGEGNVLSDVKLSFQKGSITTILGKNGCGKSTLLRAIAGLLPSTVGEVRLDGHSLAGASRRKIAQRIALLPQNGQIPAMTVAQMVLLGRFPHLSFPKRYGEKDYAIAKQAMMRVGILSFADRPVSTLSGGMRQSAFLAMALTQDTEVILLDEPTASLDVSHALALMRLLRTLAEGGKTIVTVMHELPLALSYCDRAVIIDKGSIAYEGEPKPLLSTGVIEKTFGVPVVWDEGIGYHYKY